VAVVDEEEGRRGGFDGFLVPTQGQICSQVESEG
jgi:hypothetical protein